jgi:outer membrane lipoprotein-sorting protein
VKYLMIITVLLISLTIGATELEELYKMVISNYDNIITYEAELEQSNYWSEIDVSKSSSGKIFYNSDSLFISYLPPDNQQLFVTGNTVIMHDPNTSQAVYMDKSDFYIKPIQIIKSYWQDSQKKLIDDSDAEMILLVKGDEELTIIIDNYLIKSVAIKDITGNSVTYKFSNERINHKLPNNIFTPDFPDHTNIIDNRMMGE